MNYIQKDLAKLSAVHLFEKHEKLSYKDFLVLAEETFKTFFEMGKLEHSASHTQKDR